jgi:hypothetical protein
MVLFIITNHNYFTRKLNSFKLKINIDFFFSYLQTTYLMIFIYKKLLQKKLYILYTNLYCSYKKTNEIKRKILIMSKMLIKLD